MEDALSILNRFWGYPAFRKKQDQIIQNILDNKDTLALLPTGGGKSICYQVPGLMSEGVCLVISPLIALMQDQVAQLKKRGIKAVAITSGLSKREIDIQLDNAIYGSIKFLYVSPERLKSRLFLQRLGKMKLNLIAVDEAHCISEWGYDFRPSYLEIAAIRKVKPDTPVLALTATATPDVAADIMKRLDFQNPTIIQETFTRNNLIYNILQSNNKLNRIQEFLKDNADSGIIYCATRKAVKSICKHLLEIGVSASFYHGGLDFETRKQRQQDWIDGKIKVMVSTNAFGMGIDKSDVRFVLHYDIPESIEAYFQEAGRAGRDGETAVTYLFYEPIDIDQLRTKVEAKFPSLEEIKTIYKALGNHFQLATGSGLGEVFEIDILEFCEKYNKDLISTYNALKFLEIGHFIGLSENFSAPAKIHFTCDAKQLYEVQVKDEAANRVIQFILRTQMGVFEDFVLINEKKIAKHLNIQESAVVVVLKQLNKIEFATYIPRLEGTYITYTTERLTDNNLSLPVEVYHKRKEAAILKLDSMIGLLTTTECVSSYILNYFGEHLSIKCNKCDRCLIEISEVKNVDVQKDIESYLNLKFNNKDEVVIQDIISDLSHHSKEVILENLRILIDHNTVKADNLGKVLLKN